MLILAGHVGLRRSQIPPVNISNMFEDLGGSALAVVSKDAKRHVVPLFVETAALLFHMGSKNPERRVLPCRAGGHIGSKWLGMLAARVLPHG